MTDYALLIVENASASAIAGRLIDPETAEADWPAIEIRFGKPLPDLSRSFSEQRSLDDSEEERRSEFDLVCATVQMSSMVRLEYARGDWDPVAKTSFMSAYGAARVCEPAASAGVLALAREATPPQDEEYPRSGSYFSRPFARRIGELADPG